MATLAELNIELAEIKAAISAIRRGGQSYTITSQTNGTMRTVTMANYKDLLADQNRIEAQIASANNNRAVRIRAGW